MYSIYHIPTFVHKDGSIGKIGCTHQEPKVRVEKQGYSSFEILETHDCIDSASVREIELQKEYGYKVDIVSYKHSYNQRVRLAGSKSNKKTQSARKNGIISGKKRSKKVLQYDLDGNFIKEWNSIREAHYNTNISRMGISRCCSNRASYITAGGYKWKYKD